jgi:hypothetical protein
MIEPNLSLNILKEFQRVGDSVPGIVPGPGQFDWDATLQKTAGAVGVSKSTFGQIPSSSVNPHLI